MGGRLIAPVFLMVPRRFWHGPGTDLFARSLGLQSNRCSGGGCCTLLLYRNSRLPGRCQRPLLACPRSVRTVREPPIRLVVALPAAMNEMG